MRKRKTSSTRKVSICGFELVAGGHNFFALLDMDITDLRKHLRIRRREGNGGSLFAFILKAIGICVREFPEFNAMVNYRHTTYFDQVDISIPIEMDVDGVLQAKQYLLRDINAKTLKEVDIEIHLAKTKQDDGTGYVFSPFGQWLLTTMPKFLVLLFYRILLLRHSMVQKLSGTIFVTSVSMFSTIPGYIVPYIGGPKAVSFALGSSSKKPVVVHNAIEIREIMNITATFNHDLIDGAPAARFINRFRELLEKSYTEVL